MNVLQLAPTARMASEPLHIANEFREQRRATLEHEFRQPLSHCVGKPALRALIIEFPMTNLLPCRRIAD